jgi:hypothetical protein
MKRIIFFLLMTMILFTFGAQAQVAVFEEGFEEGVIPADWINIDSDGDNFLWEHSSVQGEIDGHNSASSAVSFSYDNNTYHSLTPDNWLITPAIPLNGTSSLTYWFAVGDASYPEDHYGVYISTTTTDLSAFTLLFEETASSDNGSWTFRSIDLTSYSDNTVYIAFRHYNCPDNFAIALDDITVFSTVESPTLIVLPSILDFGSVAYYDTAVHTVAVHGYYLTDISATVTAPYEISTDNVSFSSSASLPATGGTLYVRYIPTGTGIHTGSITISADSITQTVTLNGQCVDCSVPQFPLSESFESMNDLGCWQLFNANSENPNAITLSNFYASDGSHSLRFSSYTSTSNYYQYLITPEMPVTDIKMVTFDYMTSGQALESFRVGYSTTTDDLDAFTWESPITTITENWTQYINPNIPGEAKYIAINYTSNYLYYLYIDNFEAQIAPACGLPIGLTVSSPGNTAVFSWANANVDHWDVAYGPSGFDPDEIDSTALLTHIIENTISIPNLTDGVSYDFYVRAKCPGEHSDWAGPVTTTPYHYVMGIIGSDTITACNVTVTDNGGANGNYSIECDYTLTIYPETEGSVLSVSGIIACENYYDYLHIYNGDNTTDLIAEISSEDDGEELTFGPYTSEIGPLTLLFHSDYSNSYDGFVATVTCVEAPTCPKPTTMTADIISYDAASISWNCLSENPNGFNVVWSENPIVNPDSIAGVLTTTTTSIELTNLTPNTTYYVMAQTNCGSLESEWSNVLTFTTACLPINSIPYTEDFENYGFGVGSYPDCWFKLNTATSDRPYIYANGYNSSEGSLYFWANPGTYNIAIMPMLDTTIALNTLQVSFMYKASYASNSMIVGVMTSPTDADSFAPVDTIYPGNPVSNWVKREVDFNLYTGTGRYIAFKNESNEDYAYGFIDNLIIRPIPSCPAPNLMTVTAITTSSVTLDWDETGTAQAWEIVYGAPGFNPDSANVVLAENKPFTVVGLNASTIYQFYVRAACSESQHSDWCEPVTSATECDLMSIPYTEDFNAYYGSSTATAPYNYPDDDLPLCWSFLNRSTTSYTYPTAFLSSISSYAVSGNCLFFHSSNTTPLYAVLPGFTEDLHTLQIHFTYRNEGLTASNGILSLGYLTDPDDTATFVEIAAYPRTIEKTEVIEILNSIPASIPSARLAFKYTGGTNSFYYLAIDNILVEQASICMPPTQLTAIGSTTNEVTLNWTPGGNEPNWEIEYGHAGFAHGTGTHLYTSTNPYFLNDLMPSTTYDFYVRSICAPGDTSSWVGPATAMTNSMTMPTNDAISITTCSLTIFDDGGPTGNYSSNCMSFLTIYPEDDDHVIAISGTLDSDEYFDYLYFYDGADIDAPLLGAYSGPGVTIPTLTSTTGPISVVFSSDEQFQYGGFELTVTCAESTTPSGATVTTDSASAITQTSATLHATISNPNDQFIFDMGFEWQVNGSSEIHYAYAENLEMDNTFTADLSDLEPNTTYSYRAFILYDFYPVYGELMTFTTDSIAGPGPDPEPCDAPIGLHTTAIENHSISIAWDENENVNSWNIRYRIVNGDWSSAISNTNSHVLTGLEGLTTYEIQVQANCGDSLSEWSSSITAQTTNVGIVSHLENSVTLFPNPAKEYVDIRINGEFNVTAMEVYDVYGKLIRNLNVIDNPTRINVSGLASGMYFVRVTTNAGTTTKTFVKK